MVVVTLIVGCRLLFWFVILFVWFGEVCFVYSLMLFGGSLFTFVVLRVLLFVVNSVGQYFWLVVCWVFVVSALMPVAYIVDLCVLFAGVGILC